MLNWFVRNWTGFFLHLAVCKKKKIIWNITVYMNKNGFGIKWPIIVDMN